ncbi:MAG TPA: hypothetical protein VGF20_02910 [Candidatus Acidoferrum sp.]
MRPAGVAVIAGIFSLIVVSWLIHARKNKNMRWVVAALGLSLVTISFALYVTLQWRLFRHPEIAFDTRSVLVEVRSFTRFYPTSAALLGAAFGPFGEGTARWTIFLAGLLVGFFWYLFTISLL